MKISIVTAVYNAELVLPQMIESVKAQTYANYELIIIDGFSKDNTVSIIEKYQDSIAKWISEKDLGIYDAWNKGIKRATGDWIMFLGADDRLVPDGLEKYVKYINSLPGNKNLDYISSRVQMIDQTGKPIWISGWKWEWPKFLRKMTVAHPGSLHARSLFKKYGSYDISYKITGDYEFLLRPQEKLATGFFNEVTVLMTEGGASDSIAAIKEHCRAAIHTGGGSPLIIYLAGGYVILKSKFNKLSRKFGLNTNIKRSVDN